MIHVVTAENRHLYGEALAEMHRLRRVHFVEERGWAAMTVRQDGGEYDEYDDAEMIYLLSLDESGRVGCSMRMRPAEAGSVLTDIFPHLVAADEPPLTRRDVWEISRYFAAAHCRGQSGRKRQAEIRLAALEVARTRGVNRLIGMIDLEILPGMLTGSGWRVRTLGLPAPYPEGIAQAIEVQVTHGALVDMAEMFGLEQALALELDPARAPQLPPHEIEALLLLGRGGADRARIIVALVRRILEIQDHADEEQLIGMVAYVDALLHGEAAAAH
ncbi:MAG TPA: acyl-homoserine-lactone synthase [Phenylobacterium sp.]|nr:acyl-homoserine-lactone synthase [Phenylobacterium sp.]